MKKIIIAGNWSWDHCEKAFSDCLKFYNFHVIPFVIEQESLNKISQLIPTHFSTKVFEDKLMHLSLNERPDYIFLWNATHIGDKTISSLKKEGISIITYSNDDPYTRLNKPLSQTFLWRNFLNYIKYSDFHFVYRPINLIESKKYTTAKTFLLPSYFIPEIFSDLQLNIEDDSKFSCDIVFIGHYENDYRSEYIESIFDHGYKIKLFGTGWNEKAPERIRKKFGEINRLNQINYFKSLKASKICLAFLSKFNRDVYTRRCFEIPGSGNLLLCERTDFMKKFFIEDKEAVFFETKEEMLSKIEWLIADPELIEKISKAGQVRVNKDGHDIKSRVGYFVDLISEKSSQSL